MTVLRKAPVTGVITEDRPNGLFYMGDLAEGREMINDRDWRVMYNATNGRYTVEIAYLTGFNSNDYGGVAEWGNGQTLSEAWRYALGAALGGYDDPIITDTNKLDPGDPWDAEVLTRIAKRENS